MVSFPRTLATLAFLVMCSAASAETGPGVVRGAVVDESGGVVPGVTVVATAADGRTLATAVTDGVGGYVLGSLPPGPVHLTFELAGFETAVVELTVRPGVESRVVQRLGLAAITESVVVYSKAPVDPPRPLVPLVRQRPVLPPPPHQVLIPVPTHDRDSICGPAKPGATAGSFGTILLRRDKAERGLYYTGDELVVDGGTLNGLEVGRNLVVRRYYRVSGPESGSATGEHSSGLLQIVSAEERSSIAVVVYACDELMKGDFLASFTPEPIRIPDPVGIPAFDAAARILFADAGQTLGVPRRLMVIDQGSEDSIRVGQRLTLFRRQGWDASKPDVVGDAIVVAVRANSATIRVERASDAITSGDWAAPQRQ
jgi:Carboxypeptidase regulatory-like domain